MGTYQGEWSSCLACCFPACWPTFPALGHLPQRYNVYLRPLGGSPHSTDSAEVLPGAQLLFLLLPSQPYVFSRETRKSMRCYSSVK